MADLTHIQFTCLWDAYVLEAYPAGNDAALLVCKCVQLQHSLTSFHNMVSLHIIAL